MKGIIKVHYYQDPKNIAISYLKDYDRRFSTSLSNKKEEISTWTYNFDQGEYRGFTDLNDEVHAIVKGEIPPTKIPFTVFHEYVHILSGRGGIFLNMKGTTFHEYLVNFIGRSFAIKNPRLIDTTEMNSVYYQGTLVFEKLFNFIGNEQLASEMLYNKEELPLKVLHYLSRVEEIFFQNLYIAITRKLVLQGQYFTMSYEFFRNLIKTHFESLNLQSSSKLLQTIQKILQLIEL